MKLFLPLCCTLLLLSGCSSDRTEHIPPAVFAGPAPYPAAPPEPVAQRSLLSRPEQCVPYARRISGVDLYGDAHGWWDSAEPAYRRGAAPQPGAVLVLARTAKMHSGHVAVVKKILGPRLIVVTHSNWGSDPKSRRFLYHAMQVEDVSAQNNWSQVRFWNTEKNCFGFPYAARGFIYK